MAWPKPIVSRSGINRAGKILSEMIFEGVEHGQNDWVKAWDVINMWRSSHGYPVNTFQATLRRKLHRIDHDAIVAQRLKRMPSILLKLNRFRSMNLVRMQDVGGVRAVVSTLENVRELENNYKNSRFKHELIDHKDYIKEPKSSGYRSVHLVYRYNSDNAPEYNGLCVELQIRDKLQHAWATAVETAGTFLSHALKSSEGPEEWLSFFSLAGSAFAHLEGTPPVDHYSSMSALETYRNVLAESKRLKVVEKLHAFTVAAGHVSGEGSGGSYYLIVLDLANNVVNIKAFNRKSLDAATEEYVSIEKEIAAGKESQAVLVSAGPIDKLRAAYPNYFLDTHEFLKVLDQIDGLML